MKCLLLSTMLIGLLLCTMIEHGNAICMPNDPILYFPFDDDYDSAGCEVAVSLVSQGTMSHSPMGKKGKSAYFDGMSALEVPFLSTFFSDTDRYRLTVAGWFYSFGVSPPFAGLVGNGGCSWAAVPYSFELYLDIFGNTNTFLLNDIYLTTGASPVNNWEWVHIAQVYDGAFLKLYVNGELKMTSWFAGRGKIRSTGCPMTIGQISGGYYDGLIDELRLYDRALSQDDIKDVMDNMPALPPSLFPF